MLFRNAVHAAVLTQALPALAAVHEQLAAVPAGWITVAGVDANTPVSFTLGLAQQNLDQLESKLMAVSTPGNAQYGQHLQMEDVAAMFAPTTEATSAVTSWLSSYGVSNQVSDDGHWITMTTTVGTANKLLNTTFQRYENNGTSKIRTTQYSVPDTLSSYIDLIDPTVYFGKTVANKAINLESTKTKHVPTKRAIDASCSVSITPKCIKELYNVGNYTPSVKSGSKVGFGSFLNQSALYSDLYLFESYYGIPKQTFNVTLINGATNDQDDATAQVGEANLDVQNIVGVAHPLPVEEFITGGSPPFIPNLDEPTAADNQNEPYIPYYQYLLSQPNSALPQVISNSYGDDEQTVPLKYAIRTCNMIGMMGLRGFTILESSGDTGVGAPCQSNDGKKTPQFTPTFPGTCPYITAVGGTQAVSPEVAWVDGSGGFSNYFTRPLYQEFAVEDYLTNHISPAVKKYYTPYTNFNGRGFPDISAHSLTPDYYGYYYGSIEPNGGTSAAAPVVAGIIALLNDARLRAKLPPLGFLNPLLYGGGFKALNDITGGGTVGCTGVNGQTGAVIPGASVIPYASWNSTVGWDPATGLGTPNFQKLKALVLKY